MKYRLRHSQTTLQQLCALSFFIYPLISVCKHPAVVGLVASIASVIAIATKSIASATRCRCAYMRYVRSTFESAVGKNEKCAAVYNTAYGTQKQPCNSVNAYFFHISTHIRVQAPCYCGYMKKQPHGCLQGCFFVGAVWHNLYEPVLEETAVLSAVSISFSVFTMCSFVSFRCSGLSVKL